MQWNTRTAVLLCKWTEHKIKHKRTDAILGLGEGIRTYLQLQAEEGERQPPLWLPLFAGNLRCGSSFLSLALWEFDADDLHLYYIYNAGEVW